MGHRSGLGGFVSYKAETTYGTYVAPDRHLELLTEGLVFNREKIVSQSIRRGSYHQRTGRWAVNKKGGTGAISFELGTKGFGLLFKHAMGAAAITTPGGATNARLHRHTFGDLDDLSLTIQKGVADTGGTTNPLSFLGCVVTDFEMGIEVDGIWTLGLTIDAQDMVTDESLVTPSYPTGDRFLSYQQTAVELDGSPSTNVTSLSFTSGNAMKTDRFFVQSSALKKRPVRNAMAPLGGSLTVEFDSMTEANYFLNAAPGEEIPVQATATGEEIDTGVNNFMLDVTAAKCVLDGDVPVIAGPDVVSITLPFEVMDDGSAEPLVVDYVTTDTAS